MTTRHPILRITLALLILTATAFGAAQSHRAFTRAAFDDLYAEEMACSEIALVYDMVDGFDAYSCGLINDALTGLNKRLFDSAARDLGLRVSIDWLWEDHFIAEGADTWMAAYAGGGRSYVASLIVLPADDLTLVLLVSDPL